MEKSLDFLIAGPGMSPAEILTHQIHPGLEEIERRPERGGWRGRRGHAANVRRSKAPCKRSRSATYPVDLGKPHGDLVPTGRHWGRHRLWTDNPAEKIRERAGHPEGVTPALPVGREENLALDQRR